MIFDLEDTLVSSSSYADIVAGALVKNLAVKLDCSHHAATERFDLLRSTMPSAVATYEALGLPRSELIAILSGLNPGNVTATAGAVRGVRVLADLGVPLGLVTNAPSAWAARLLTAAGFNSGSFNPQITLCDYLPPKPSRVPFEAALQLLNVEPSMSVMVGDREDVDLMPARELGMATILVSETSPIRDQFLDLVKLLFSTDPSGLLLPRSGFGYSVG